VSLHGLVRVQPFTLDRTGKENNVGRISRWRSGPVCVCRLRTSSIAHDGRGSVRERRPGLERIVVCGGRSGGGKGGEVKGEGEGVGEGEGKGEGEDEEGGEGEGNAEGEGEGEGKGKGGGVGEGDGEGEGDGDGGRGRGQGEGIRAGFLRLLGC
jgi:hypothetical protein